MSFDPSALEADLRRLNAAPLDDLLLERLEACADETWTRLGPAETAMVHQLRTRVPAKLPAALSASLEALVQSVPFPLDHKIVTFPKSAPVHKQHGSRWWGTAAAVALTGAVTALMLPVKPQETAGNAPNRARPYVASAPASSELIPAGFNSGLSEAVDEGFIWQPDQQPHRVLKVVYKDCVTLKDANGEIYQVERPRVEYILVPAHTN